MSLGVNTNVSSLTAHRSLAKNETMMNQAMTRLSTGLKINSASDDAAGLAIVQRMTSQIQGLAMAVKNAEARTRHTSLPRHFREMKELMAL